MKRICNLYTHSLATLLALPVLLSSCSQDDGNLRVYSDEVAFVADIPGVTSRTYDLDKLLVDSGFAVSAISPEAEPVNGIVPTHCEGVIVRREVDGIFRSEGCRWPLNDGDNFGWLRFFAFHPSHKEMRRRARVGEECFAFSNATVKAADGMKYDYWLTHFRVAPDISEQVDFVTAIGQGNKTANIYNDIKLVFEHQLSGVEINVWGGSTLYDVEIAGVRIGGFVIEADFGLSTVVANPVGDDNTIGEWRIPTKPLRGYVDYVFTTGDKVVNIRAGEHDTKETAASIMGNGGKAMLIPQKQDLWDYANDRENVRGMYFCALIHMTEHDGDHHRIYPSTDPESQDYIVFLSVNKADGTVMKRLDKYGNVWGTNTKYNIPSTEEVRHYGWAAAPVCVDWKPGYTYSYVLDYTKGVGVHDPTDLNPATTIVDWSGVEVSTTTGDWGGGELISYGDWGANTNNTGPDGTVWWK